MLTLWPAMALFAITGAITPGPVNLLALQHGMHRHAPVAAAFVLGASLSYAGVVWLTGHFALQLQDHPLLVKALQWGAAVYLWYLSWRIASAPAADFHHSPTAPPPAAPVAWLQGCLAQALNPKAWFVALSGVGLAVLPHPEIPWTLGIFCTISLAACLLGVGFWAALGCVLAPWLRKPGPARWANRVLGATLAVSVVGLFV